MRSLTATACFVFTSFFAFAQQAETSTDYKAQPEDFNSKKVEKSKNYNVNYQIANQEAYFEAGEDSLFRYLIAKISMPPAAVSANLDGNSMIGFQVNFDGKASNAYAISKVGYGIDEQLMGENGCRVGENLTIWRRFPLKYGILLNAWCVEKNKIITCLST